MGRESCTLSYVLLTNSNVQMDYYVVFVYQFNVCHPKVFNTYINIQWCVSQSQQNFTMFIIVLGQHVSILIESSSDPLRYRSLLRNV